MMRWLIAGGGLLSVCLVLSACGKSSNDVGGTGGAGGDGGGETAGVSQAAFASSYAQVLCSNMASCCETAKLEYDADNCEKATTKQVQALLDSQLSPNAVYDAKAAGDCLTMVLTEAECGNWGNVPIHGACGRIFIGKLDAGQECQASSECKSQSCFRQGDDSSGPKTCWADDTLRPALGKKGDHCTTTCQNAEECFVGPTTTPAGAAAEPPVACVLSDGLSCQDGTCQPRPGDGEPCGFPGECAPGLACVDRLCGARLADGKACFLNEDCASNICDDGKCAPAVTAAQCKTDGPF